MMFAGALGALIGAGLEPVAATESPWQIVPAPAQMQAQTGRFVPGAQVKLALSGKDDKALRELAELAAGILHESWQREVGIQSGKVDSADVVLQLDPDAKADAESYRLDVAEHRITLSAPAPAGLFYGLQTLRQLAVPGSEKGGIAAVRIDDAPRFKYRGMHLDVGRHLYPLEFIKRYIDLMARYKFNTFHWHLTEDQGWRIEIKRYPLLTKVGAFRKETILGRNFDPYFGDGQPYGGFYTQAQVREVVAYAAQRQVTILPEIEMPGHSKAALAAYPELACTPGPFEVSTIWGVEDDVLCPNEATFKFLEGVLSEVIALFPGRYIHLGGDEAPTRRWKESAFVQDLMKREGMKNEHAVQGYFLRRIEAFLNQHERKLIGWDEILEGGLSPGATVMSWRGMQGGIAAAQQGHDVIMNPGDTYFDHCPGDPKREPLCVAGGRLPLEQVYRFDPLPPDLPADKAHHILGTQADLWSEYLPTPQSVEYMAFPRELALAEVAWSPRARRDWADFQRRLAPQYAALDRLGVHYRLPEVDGLDDVTRLDASATLTLESPLSGATIRYTLNGDTPDANSPRYEKPIAIALTHAGTPIAARLFLADGRAGPVRSAKFRHATLHAAAPIKTTALKPGLQRDYFEQEVLVTSALDGIRPTREDSTMQIGIPDYARAEWFGLTFSGWLLVPANAIYRFQLRSDDGSVLEIDDNVVIDRDGGQSASESRGTLALAAGAHKFALRYFQGSGDKALELKVGTGDAVAQSVPVSWLRH
ncbi:MAG: beta-N-acetylhexosaminidase [Gammaproteobacteria bacterium]|nr:MAG: beta-N-acetylhexosaminidase [Gammaproteobacteria bacterium]